MKKNLVDTEKCFRELSIEERANFDEETLVNLNKMKKNTITTEVVDQSKFTYMVLSEIKFGIVLYLSKSDIAVLKKIDWLINFSNFRLLFFIIS